MTSFEKIRKIRGYQDEKCWLEVKKLKDGVRLSEKQFAGFADEVTPAGCGLDFEGISSPQSPVITTRMYRTHNSVIGRQNGRLYRNPHGE